MPKATTRAPKPRKSRKAAAQPLPANAELLCGLLGLQDTVTKMAQTPLTATCLQTIQRMMRLLCPTL